MKQFLLLILMVGAGFAGSLFSPFWGLLLYYTFAVLRPQTLWQWALPYDVSWSRFAVLAVLIGVFLNVSHLWVRLRLSLVSVLIIAFAMLLMLSVLTSHDPGTAFYWGIEYAKVLLLALLVGAIVQHFWQVRVMAVMIVVCLGYIAWEANSRYLFDGRLDIYHHGYGEMDNNGAGLLIAMGLPFCYAFATTASRWWLRAAVTIVGAIMLHAVLMTYSRGAMLAALLSGVWLLARHRPRLSAAGIAVVCVIMVSVLAGVEIRERFVSTAQFHRDYSAQSRFMSWEAALNMVADHPLTGVGIRNSNAYSHPYGADHVGRTIHNQYLQIAADSGIPTALTYIALVIVALLMIGRARRMLLDAEDDREHPVRNVEHLRRTERIILSCQASLIAFVFGGLFVSLEVFELPWLLIALAGVMPRVIEQELAEMRAAQPTDEAAPPEPALLARDGRPRRPCRRRAIPASRAGVALT